MITRRRELSQLERANGVLRLTVRRRDDVNAVADLEQAGCGRLLFPARRPEEPVEAVVVNTSGGLTGGDRFDIRAEAQAGAQLVLTTQACEKVYRSDGAVARLRTSLKAGPGSKFFWLPQETILFEGSALKRSLAADVAGDARLLVAEAVTLGRAAMGETIETARFRDSWRVRRDGRLVFAEETAASGDDWARARAAKAALGGEAIAFATLVLIAPDASERLQPVRALLESHGIDGGASVVDGLLVLRLTAGPGLALRKAMIPLIECLSGARLPRVWIT